MTQTKFSRPPPPRRQIMTGPYVSVKKVWNKVGANEIKKTAVRERRRKGKREKEGNKKG